ncbi:PREDICTED: uncharacterized protein LOC104748719 [Camelina sativa]|uniref:Uncharacterized protein LOC104748719 n=1 Tax=Camelina sativa TaxID=90675 RepID=A0ABM0WBH5_CAMSA|nr:PREDICTED: uncharacterized protein LOC104748719 [Camelina sativa]
MAVIKKNWEFQWGEEQDRALKELKRQLTQAPLLTLPDFTKTFEVECDTSGLGISAVLTQVGKPVAYFSEKLSGAALNYPTYDKELYTLVRAMEVWQHYLLAREFVIHTDHKTLKHLRGQTNLKRRHAKWLEFIESFPYVIKYKKGKENVVADALSRRHALITTMDAQRLCIPIGSIRELLVREAHCGGLSGHFGITKMLAVLQEHFYWSKMRSMVEKQCGCCVVCRASKSTTHLHGLYMPLPVSTAPWIDLFMDFILSLPLLAHKDNIMVVVDWFLKMVHFIPCNKNNEAVQLANLFFSQVIRLHGLPCTIISD